MRSDVDIFRGQALESHSRGYNTEHGNLLQISPAWTTWTYWLLIGLFVAASLYLVIARIDEYAKGIGVIRDDGRTVLTAAASGAIRRIAVQAGDPVHAGQPLVYFEDSQERIELERLQADFNAQQVNRLRNPNDPAALQQVATIRSQIEAAERRLKERIVLAPRDGRVQDLRLRLNQVVNSGESLMTIVGENDRLVVLAVLPGQYRPLLKKGSRLRLELTGFRYAYQEVTIEQVGNEVVGPNEIRRFLGQDIADSATFQGPSVIVQAYLPSRSFNADGQWREYHEGMHGTAEARVRSEIILAALVPGVRMLLEKGHE
jgi:multidrug efflux pump subunit AcrA (membrane-fusion protein)